MISEQTLNWLLSGDPSVIYQTKRDLLKVTKRELAEAQKKIENEGWGAKLLALQDEDGKWAGGFYSPKWISTTYTLLVLKRLGLNPKNPQAIKACKLMAEHGINKSGGIGYGWATYPNGETCVTGITLSLFSYFHLNDKKIHKIVEYLLREQMSDGGWNCRKHRDNPNHSSFHTTINVLEGLYEFENRFGRDEEITTARKRAHKFLFDHNLYKSHRTGEVVDAKMTRFSFPPRWKYDVMRVLDYFQSCDEDYHPGMKDALQLLASKEKKGKWQTQQKHSGEVFFEFEPVGKPGRMNTLRALRILKKYGSNIEK